MRAIAGRDFFGVVELVEGRSASLDSFYRSSLENWKFFRETLQHRGVTNVTKASASIVNCANAHKLPNTQRTRHKTAAQEGA